MVGESTLSCTDLVSVRATPVPVWPLSLMTTVSVSEPMVALVYFRPSSAALMAASVPVKLTEAPEVAPSVSVPFATDSVTVSLPPSASTSLTVMALPFAALNTRSWL